MRDEKPVATDEDWAALRERIDLPQPGPHAWHA